MAVISTIKSFCDTISKNVIIGFSAIAVAFLFYKIGKPNEMGNISEKSEKCGDQDRLFFAILHHIGKNPKIH